MWNFFIVSDLNPCNFVLTRFLLPSAPTSFPISNIFSVYFLGKRLGLSKLVMVGTKDWKKGSALALLSKLTGRACH